IYRRAGAWIGRPRETGVLSKIDFVFGLCRTATVENRHCVDQANYYKALLGYAFQGAMADCINDRPAFCRASLAEFCDGRMVCFAEPFGLLPGCSSVRGICSRLVSACE